MVKKKIHIIGGPGSGKSYVAKALSEKLNISCYDLDDIYWLNDKKTYDVEADPKIRNKRLFKIIKKKEWILEGVYLNWTKPSFEESELIIILQPNKSIRSWRITRRFIKRKLGIEESKKKETWKSFLKLFKWNWNYDKKNLPRVYTELEPYKYKIIKITKSRVTSDEILKLADSERFIS